MVTDEPHGVASGFRKEFDHALERRVQKGLGEIRRHHFGYGMGIES